MAPPHPAHLGPQPSPLEPLPATPAVLRAPPNLSACCPRKRKWPSSEHLQNPQRLHPNSCVSLISHCLTSRTSNPRSVLLKTSSTSQRGARQVQMPTIHPDFTSADANSNYQLEMHRLTGQWSESADFSYDRPGSVTGRSVSSLADSEPILLLPAAQAGTSQPRAHSQLRVNVSFLRENDSNFNGIQCKWRLIMYLCRARWGLHS